ncbi:MAG: hypothetical protein ACI3X6_05080, partial [Alloprevotella sp.]
RGHKDFQSFALPTELWHRAVLRCKSRDNFLCGKGERAFFYVKVEKRGENAACFVKKEATLRLCGDFLKRTQCLHIPFISLYRLLIY